MLSSSALPRKRLALPLAVGLGLACGGPADSFTSGRAEDPCSETWPVCNTVAGCILGDSNYVQGTFPGTYQYVVETAGPATVTVNVFLQSVTGGGSTTTIDWWETGCTSSFPTTVEGKVFVGESQTLGVFTRQQSLTGVGDHLVTIQSDATASFLLDVSVAATN
ncbi:MAG: hypothetical protein ACYDCL_07575 [Myxococcales bacterium]